MTDSIIGYRAVSHPPKRRWTWTIPTIIVGGAIVGGLWAGHHQPEPVTCEPGSHPAIYQTASPQTVEPVMCWPDKVIWTTPGYDP
jgi:hypothetical protein